MTARNLEPVITIAAKMLVSTPQTIERVIPIPAGEDIFFGTCTNQKITKAGSNQVFNIGQVVSIRMSAARTICV